MDISQLNLKPISEDEVISIFLKGELKSKRFSQNLLTALKKFNANESIILRPNITNSKENSLRKKVLEETRKYLTRRGLFEGFPDDIKWYKTDFPSSFLINHVKYINYDYWIKLTNGSRLPKDAIENIKRDQKIFNVSYENFLEASGYFKKNRAFDEIIIVSEKKKFVVLEGHLRLTVFALNKEILPEKTNVIIGISERMSEWDNF